MVRFFLALCVVVFVVTAFGGGQISVLSSPPASQCLRWGALHPALVFSEPWRLLSAVFVHLGIFHLLMNMSALVSLGAGLERTLGSTRFVITFVGTGLVGFVISVAWSIWGPGAMALTAGASGGLFGLVGFEVGYLYRARDPRWKQALTRVVIAAVIIAFLMPVNNAAHFGGGVVGMLLGYLSFHERLWRRLSAFWRAVAVLFVVASVASIVLSHQSDVWREVRASETARGLYD